MLTASLNSICSISADSLLLISLLVYLSAKIAFSISDTKRLVALSSIMLAGCVAGCTYLLAFASMLSNFCLSAALISPSVLWVAGFRLSVVKVQIQSPQTPSAFVFLNLRPAAPTLTASCALRVALYAMWITVPQLPSSGLLSVLVL